MLSISACGNVAFDPRTASVGNSEVTNFTILVNSKLKGEEVTSAIDCAVWGPRAKAAADFIRKGQQVTVTGTGQIVTYEGKNGYGAKLSINVVDFTLPPKPKAETSADNGLNW